MNIHRFFSPGILLSALCLASLLGLTGADIAPPSFSSVSSAPVTAGDLDTSFGDAGRVVTSFGRDRDSAYDVAIQADGKIVAVGGAAPGAGWGWDFGVARYNSNGSLDASFGAGGLATTSFGEPGTENSAYALALQGDGKIVVAGVAMVQGSSGYNDHFAIVRYLSNGSLDPSFDGDGKVTTRIYGAENKARAVALQGDGKIVAAGYTGTGGRLDMAVARYHSDGRLDTGFDVDGKASTDFGRNESANSVIWQPDGKIVVAGYTSGSGVTDIALARYNANGSLDVGFGAGGKVTTDFAGRADTGMAAALQPDGKIVAAGASASGEDSDFALVRYNPDGSLDTGFGVGGKVLTAIGGGSDIGNALVIQPDGKIVVSGSSAGSDGRADFALARYLSNGSPDVAFGVGGKVTSDFGGYDDASMALARQADGKLVAAGSKAVPAFNRSYFALARYQADPPASPTATPTATPTASRTPTRTPTMTHTPTVTRTPTPTRTANPAKTPTATASLLMQHVYLPLVLRR